MKDDRNGNEGREQRRPWVQRNAVWIGLISAWLFTLSGIGIKTWAQSEATAVMAVETKSTVSADHDALIGMKSDVSYIKDEQKEQRTLLTEIYKIVNRNRGS